VIVRKEMTSMNHYIFSDQWEGIHESWRELKYACKALVRHRDLSDFDLSRVIVFKFNTVRGGYDKYSGNEFLMAFDDPEFHNEA
jgi:hypothetical protein